jgi:hypothetical protein
MPSPSKRHREREAIAHTEQAAPQPLALDVPPPADVQSNARLVRYDAMCRAIDAAFEVDEVKGIRDKAIALETYARLAHNVEAERRACEIRLRAERKAGKISARLEKAKPGPKPNGELIPTRGTNSKTEALHKAGISPKQAENWEKLAAVSDEQFETAPAEPAPPRAAP